MVYWNIGSSEVVRHRSLDVGDASKCHSLIPASMDLKPRGKRRELMNAGALAGVPSFLGCASPFVLLPAPHDARPSRFITRAFLGPAHCHHRDRRPIFLGQDDIGEAPEPDPPPVGHPAPGRLCAPRRARTYPSRPPRPGLGRRCRRVRLHPLPPPPSPSSPPLSCSGPPSLTQIRALAMTALTGPDSAQYFTTPGSQAPYRRNTALTTT